MTRTGSTTRRPRRCCSWRDGWRSSTSRCCSRPGRRTCGRFDSGDLPQLRLGGLDLAASTDLLRERAGSTVSPEVAAQLVAGTGGNPLALRGDAAGALVRPAGRPRAPARPAADDRDHRARLPRPGPAPLAPMRSAGCWWPPPTDSMQPRHRGARRGGRSGPDADALAEAEGSGLRRITGGTVELRHPLVRSALYAARGQLRASPRARGAGRRAAARPDDADRRVWHRAAAADQPDAGVVDDLEAAATRGRAARWARGCGGGVGARRRAQRRHGAAGPRRTFAAAARRLAGRSARSVAHGSPTPPVPPPRTRSSWPT